jgi:DNA repair protein RadC
MPSAKPPVESSHEGHRERLRKRFLDQPDSLTQPERLELLLTYAIPRRDLSPLAAGLLDRFETIQAICAADYSELLNFPGLGETSAAFFKILESLSMSKTSNQQLPIFEPDPGDPEANEPQPAKNRGMRVFANDEVANSLSLLPEAASVSTLQEFKTYLESHLPYNSQETRHRRANYFIDRYFPSGSLNTQLHVFLSHDPSQASLQAAIFYHILKSEPAAAKVAEEYIYPALPIGQVEREEMREFIRSFLPEASDSSMKNMLRSVFYTYTMLGVASASGEKLRIRLHSGTFEAFAYVFLAEFPQPGIYTFDVLYQGPTHRWLLWDKDWIRRQLYRMRDLEVISKISEVDLIQQFTLELNQRDALQKIYSAAAENPGMLRDDPGESSYTTP